jgi:hypothetical protein
MEKPFRRKLVWPVVLGALAAAGFMPSANTAPLQAARVTVVIKDVKLLSSRTAARVASVNDNIASGTAVWTGLDSRAELTFNDLTITRLGANTVFSFNPEARNLDLGNGAVLVEVPKGAPALHIITASVTAGITGGTALFETHAGAPTKLLVMEGKGRLCSKAYPGECATALGGEMTMMTVDGHIIKPFKFDAALVFKTSKLIKDFPPLPNLDLILAVIEQQQAEQSGEASSPPSPPTEKDPIDVISASVAASPVAPSPPPSISKFGPPSAITSPNPYLITSGTAINTDPTITTNGITNLGKIYRGAAVDGPLATWLGSSPSAFDSVDFFDSTSGGFNNPDTVPIPGFLFASLRLDGDPMVSNSSGFQTLGLVSQGDITSSASGTAFTFAGINEVALIALDGSIDLSGIAFANLHQLFIYARGSSGDVTMAAPITNIDKVRIRGERDVQLNAAATVNQNFKALAGNNLVANSTVNANQIVLQSLGGITLTSSSQLLAMLDSMGNSGQVVIIASGSDTQLNVGGTIHADQGEVDIRQTGVAGQTTLNNAIIHGDVVKLSALGANGVLTIGTGNDLSADTVLKLYAPGSNGTLNFISNVTLKSPSNILAANTLNISPGVVVTISSPQPADIFTNHPNYFGFGGTGNAANSGTFGGAGAKNPQPLANAPPLGPPGQ